MFKPSSSLSSSSSVTVLNFLGNLSSAKCKSILNSNRRNSFVDDLYCSLITKTNISTCNNKNWKSFPKRRSLFFGSNRKFSSEISQNGIFSDGKFYRWNDVMFSSTFNEIVCFDSNSIEPNQFTLFREKNFIKCLDKGMFTLMPLVTRAYERLIRIVDHQMSMLPAQKIIMPSIVGKHLWLKSNRWERAGEEVFRFRDRHEEEFCLAPTHEEIVTAIVSSNRQLSHRQLPIFLYQISSKYRDELRTKYGLLRAREFVMNDLYTFDRDEDSAKKTYKRVCAIYQQLFRMLELPVLKTVGSVGSIGGKFSHEFILPTPLGEDEIYTCNDCHESFNAELLPEYMLEENAQIHCLNCKSENLQPTISGLELGHAFLLGDEYSSKMEAYHLVENINRKIPLQMGCYGLGLSRILAGSVEYLSSKINQQEMKLFYSSEEESKQNDQTVEEVSLYKKNQSMFKLRWPRLLVPFKVCLILPKKDSKEDRLKGTEFALHLGNVIRTRFGEDILLDDRSNMTIGKRLLTAKSIGIPFIIVAGRSVLDMRPKFELFDLYEEKEIVDQQQEKNLPLIMTQSQLLSYLEHHLKKFNVGHLETQLNEIKN